ncbi:MAG: DOPA 4,5-dioxygenase family protein [Alphaproteobacteria bacterium]
MSPPERATAKISGYHAHVYYGDGTREIAARIREELAERFDVELGRWRDAPVGPHPRPMYQVAFDATLAGEVIPWLMLNHAGLPVFIHPLTGDDIADHLEHALWLGEKLELDPNGL